MRGALALATLAACWTAPTPAPPRGEALPGLVWATPARAPWRLPEIATALAVEPGGASAIVGGARGFVARIDLATGAVTDEQRLAPRLTSFELARLADGRWVIVGNDADTTTTRAFVLAAATLAATEIPLAVAPDRAAIHAGVAVTDDGGVVIAGKGLPLAIYDPRTWQMRTLLAPERGWNRPRVVGGTLAVALADVAYGFDLATRARRVVGRTADVIATAPRLARLDLDGDGVRRAVVLERGVARATLPPADALAVTLSDDGARAVVATRVGVFAYAEPFDDAHRTAAVALGPAGLAGVYGIALVDDRALVSTPAGLRVIDLARGTSSPPIAPPWGEPSALALAGDDTIAAVAPDLAWWLGAAGAVETVALAGEVALAPDGARVATFRPMASEVVVRSRGGATQTWRTALALERVWVGTSTLAAVGSTDDEGMAIATSTGTRLAYDHGRALDVDADAGVALVGNQEGGAYVARLGPAPRIALVGPTCGPLEGALERGGPRAITYANVRGRGELVLWDRTDGTALARARLPAAIRDVAFVRGADAIALALVDRVAVWAPRAGTLRTFPAPRVSRIAATPTRLALAYEDGRVALLDRAAVEATVAPIAVAPGARPARCNPDDPFAPTSTR